MSETLDRFDLALSSLKEMTPSPAFDSEFKRRLSEAVARRREESAFDAAFRRLSGAIENLREALLVETPVLVRVMASFVIIFSVSLYAYSMQPASPSLSAKEGVIMVQGPKDNMPREMGLASRIRPGDVIFARDNGQGDFGLSGRYAVRIKDGARLKIVRLTPKYGKGKAVFQLMQGRMLASVEKGFKGSRFIVNTETAVATALGTKFSVDVSRKERVKTQVCVLQGKVNVTSQYKPEKMALAKQIVTVGAGQKTEVLVDGVPSAPQRLIEEEWRQLDELYQLGKKPQVILLIKAGPDRAKQLLRPCPIYISDERPREIPRLLEAAVLNIAEAVKTGDKEKHLESIRMLERILDEHPNPKYDVQLLLYTGAYYEYLSYHKDAIKTFEEALARYPDSPLASIAQCAIGIIYEEKLNDAQRARTAYQLVIDKYPNSPEAIWAEERLGIKKSAKFVENDPPVSVLSSNEGGSRDEGLRA